MANNQQLLLGEGAGGGIPNYIEEVFSTYLYTGTGGADLTVTNGIDLSTKGGIVWKKQRNGAADHLIYQAPGVGDSWLVPNSTAALATGADYIDFTTTGFVDRAGDSASNTYASWTFREQPKFFDVVTYTGDGTSNRAISHSLTSTPGCIIVKRTDTTSAWYVYHRAVDASPSLYYTLLNTTDAKAGAPAVWDVAPTSANFTVQPSINVSAGTYVAYIFAHNAGGFGLAGTDNVISCGTFTTDGSGNATINLGYEPQWVMWKRSDGTGDWTLLDNMRGWAQTVAQRLVANTSAAEDSMSGGVGYTPFPTATGFFTGQQAAASSNYIYIAIRRGPMKVPTVGTSVYNAEAFTGTGATRAITTLSAPDMAWIRDYKNFTNSNTIQVYDRLRGNGVRVRTGLTNADNTNAAFLQFNNQMLATVGNDSETNGSGALNVAWAFKRAPGFFDVVCYTGTGSNTTFTHNLGTVPEVIIIKSRSGARNWNYLTTFGASTYTAAILNDTYAPGASPSAYDTLMQAQPTATQFSVSTAAASNNSGETYVAYLFATCAGVSKVGSYTGNGSSQTIACGFTAGSRFVMIKRISASGDWYVWDSARGIIAGNDPYLLLNSTAAEVTSTDYIDTDTTGFEISSTAPAAINASAGTFIFLAIA